MNAAGVLVAFLRRDWRIEISYRTSFGMDLLSSFAVLFLFFFVGKVVNPGQVAPGQDLSGGYFGYVAVGLALLDIMQVGLISYSRKLREEQTTGTFEALMATPVSPSWIILSSAAYDLLRATVTGFLTILAAIVIFGLRLETSPESLALALIALIGSLGLFASLGVAVAAVTVIVKKATGLAGLISIGLGTLSGVYFPINVLPEPLEFIAKVLPFTWALDVVRAALLGGNVNGAQLAGLLGLAVLLVPISLIGFGLALRHSRQAGTLAEY